VCVDDFLKTEIFKINKNFAKNDLNFQKLI